MVDDGLDLFEYTHHTATEGNMLRSLQFTWEVSRAAMQFYVEHVHALVDIHPRRLVMIAQTIRDNPDPDKHMARLSLMLRDSDQRPKLIVATTWVAMDGGLLLPKHPPPPNRARGTLKPVVAAEKPQPKLIDNGGTASKPEHELFDHIDFPPDPPPAASQPVPSATGSELSVPTPEFDLPIPASSAPPERIDPQPVDPNDGYEPLDENGCVEHFGIPAHGSASSGYTGSRGVLCVGGKGRQPRHRCMDQGWVCEEPEQPDVVQYRRDPRGGGRCQGAGREGGGRRIQNRRTSCVWCRRITARHISLCWGARFAACGGRPQATGGRRLSTDHRWPAPVPDRKDAIADGVGPGGTETTQSWAARLR